MIRKPTATPVTAQVDAVPEPIEPRPTARLDVSRLDGLLDGSRGIDQDALEIAVEAADAQAPSRQSSARIAHTIRRDTPPVGRPAMPLPRERNVHTRETLPPPMKIATGSASELPIYRPPAPVPADAHDRVTGPHAVDVPIDIDVAAEEDTSRPIDAGVELAPPTSPVKRPASGRAFGTFGRASGIVLLLILLAGAGVTATALFLY